MEKKEPDLNTIYRNVIIQYKKIVKSIQKSELDDFLNRKDVVMFKESPEIYSQLRSMRGNIAAMTGDFARVEKEYKLGFLHCPSTTRLEYLFDWTNAYWLLFERTKSGELRKQTGNRILEKVKGIQGELGAVPNKELYRLALAGMAAFIHTYFGENQAALDGFFTSFRF